MWNKLRPMLPHAAIMLANAYVVFFLIDRVNTSMNFIDNNLTKGMLLAMCLLVVASWRTAPRRAARGKGAARADAGAAARHSAVQSARPAQSAGKHVAKAKPAGRSGA